MRTKPNIFAFLLFTLIFLGMSFFIKQLVGPKIVDKKTQSVSSKPTSPQQPAAKIYGVNISGGEFGPESLPGVMDKDYIYPQKSTEYQYFKNKNITLIRLPIRWERVQREAFGPLHTDDIDEIKKVFVTASQNNMKVILDLHNFGRYYGKALSSQEANQLADVWSKLAITFKDDPALYGYELMNEPHDLPGGSKTWAGIVQHVTDKIRQVDGQTLIIIPGYNWQASRGFSENNPHFPIQDLGNNLVYSAHTYFDSNTSGRYTKSFDEDKRETNVGLEYSKDFREWLKINNVKGVFTEFGVPGNDPRWLSAMDLFLKSIHADPYVTGAIYWSSGPWWKNYALSIEPRNGADRPQMQILQKYTSPQL